MTIKRVLFEVDDNVLFDTLHKMNGDFAPLGQRIVSAMLAEPGMGDLIGMAFYGVVHEPTLPPKINIVWRKNHYGNDCAYVGEVCCATVYLKKKVPPYHIEYDLPILANTQFARFNGAKKSVEIHIKRFFKKTGLGK